LKKALLFGAFTFMAIFIQRIWMEYFSFLGAGPDLTLLILVYFAVFHDPVRGVLLAFVLGYINDALMGFQPGLYTTTYVIIFYAMQRFGKNFYLRSLIFQIIAAVTVSVSFVATEFLLLSVFEASWSIRVALLWSLPGRLIWNIVVSPVLFRTLWVIEDAGTPSLMRSKDGFGFI